jgi:acyl-CoA thioesterase FadM
MFVVSEEICFHQCDPAGYLFFAESFVLAHQTIEKFLSKTQIGRAGWFEHETVAFPLRHAECDYQSPLRAGDRCELTMRVVKVSTSSVIFEVAAADDGRRCFSVTSVHTAMSRSDHTKVDLPCEVRSVLESS